MIGNKAYTLPTTIPLLLLSESWTKSLVLYGDVANGGCGSKRRNFLIEERYSVVHPQNSEQVIQGLEDLIISKGWKASADATVALLYLIGKGKSLRFGCIAWRPVCAHPCALPTAVASRTRVLLVHALHTCLSVLQICTSIPMGRV